MSTVTGRFLVIAGAVLLGLPLGADTPFVHDGHFDGLVFDLKMGGTLTPGDASTYGSVANAMTDYSFGKFTVKLNDVLVGEEVRPSAAGEFAFDFAPGTLQAGLNRITIQNTSVNARGENTPPQYNVLSFDSHRFTFTPPPPPPQGMAIFIQ